MDIADTEVPGKKEFMPWIPSYESNGCKLAEVGSETVSQAPQLFECKKVNQEGTEGGRQVDE